MNWFDRVLEPFAPGFVASRLRSRALISGASAEEADASIIQFAQALGAGALRGDEFNSVAEQTPRLMRALADGLGVARGALKQMANDGQLTANVVINALLKHASGPSTGFAIPTICWASMPA
ncbi:tape measure protein [Pseudomonas sp. NY15437]|uniref:tape measure protein n=1 Tax=Pseudomonas sp. NY15437 TaxID=3400360 RepID=UPI003A843A65